MKYLRYVLRNIFRNKLRSLLTIAAIWMCLMLMTFLYGYLAMMDVWGKDAEKYNRAVVMNIQGFAAPVPLATLDIVRQIDGVEAATPFSWYGGIYKEEKNNFFAQFGVDPDTMFEVFHELKPHISADQLEAFKKDRQGCVCDRKLAEKNHWQVGERIPLKGNIYPFDLELKLVGIFDPPEDLQTMYFNLTYLDEGLRQVGRSGMAGNCGTIFFRAKSAGVIPNLCKTIDERFASSQFPTNTQTEKAFAQMFVKMQGNIQNFIWFIGVFVTISLTLVAANGMAMSMRERTTEIAVLKAIGFQRGLVLAMVLGESVIIATIGGVFGVAAGRGIYAMGHEFAPMVIQISHMPTSVMGWGLAVASGIGLVSGIVPAITAARLSVIDGLRRIV